jgi:hypothetical protein
MDPMLIVFQFFQNEIGRFRAALELTKEDNDELLRKAQPIALGRERAIGPAAISELSLITQSSRTV